jgi:hypothetical protein
VLSAFDPGALMSQSYALPRGPRVRLRLAGRGDAAAIAALLVRCGVSPEQLEPGRLVRFDPRRRAVICALALIDSRETLVGLGAIELDGNPDTQADVLVVDERVTEGLEDLLVAALTGRAGALARAPPPASASGRFRTRPRRGCSRSSTQWPRCSRSGPS